VTDRAAAAESIEWVAAPVPAAAGELERAGHPGWLAGLLARRGVDSAAAAQDFLTPSPAAFHDPLLLSGMTAAVARLLAARAVGEKVAIVGDYDVDGVTATALLLAVFRACGLPSEAILPHRVLDGYGFQPAQVERAVELGCRLIVTVDCGATSLDAVAAATTAGLEVVITDHHLPGAELPAGAILVNPRQPGCAYPFPDLAGVGLAWKLATAFAAAAGRPMPADALLRIACLGTIADLVPLRGENRAIAALGLRALSATRSAGLQALIAEAGLHPPYRAEDVAFRLGPRLNAAGRLASAEAALELLLCRDAERAEALAAALGQRNRERQAEEARVVLEARELLLAQTPLPPIGVAWAAGWHRGVVGIAAGRLARELARPVVLLALDDDQAVGSGRSIPGIHLHGFLSRWQERLARFGGHAQAIGLTVTAELLPSLAEEWRAAAAEWQGEVGTIRHEYELSLGPQEVTAAFLAALAPLAPHGQGNPQPLLRVGPLALQGPPRLFGNGHLGGRVRGNSTVQLLGWGWAARSGELAGSFEVLAYLEPDRRDGTPTLRLVDCRPLATA
jgi:single-stranded-DNA-specific exonuclease